MYSNRKPGDGCDWNNSKKSGIAEQTFQDLILLLRWADQIWLECEQVQYWVNFWATPTSIFSKMRISRIKINIFNRYLEHYKLLTDMESHTKDEIIFSFGKPIFDFFKWTKFRKVRNSENVNLNFQKCLKLFCNLEMNASKNLNLVYIFKCVHIFSHPNLTFWGK
jgi:hypothetical protein